MVWSYITGLLCFYICNFTVGGIINNNGHINDKWNVGVVTIIVNMVAHHLMLIIETRNFNYFIMSWYLFSFSTILMVIHFNDSYADGVYYKN